MTPYPYSALFCDPHGRGVKAVFPDLTKTASEQLKVPDG
jgi:hypothetical protein